MVHYFFCFLHEQDRHHLVHWVLVTTHIVMDPEEHAHWNCTLHLKFWIQYTTRHICSK